MIEERPEGYPKLENYTPTKFMLDTSHYDEKKADRAVTFIENLRHTKGKWAGKRFWLLPWQEQLIRDIFGVVKEDGYRQFRTAFVEICKKVGKQLALDTPIPTPDGWSTMGNLKVGDFVLSEKGEPCRVIAKSAVDRTEDAYRITFRDGDSIVAGARHQWIIDGHSGSITTEEMCPLRNISISIGGLKTHYIHSIENIGNGIPMQCIQVDSESHCYLAGKTMVPTHNSELAAAIALYLLYADNEPSAEVYGAAADRQQASIVFDVAKKMVEMSPALMKRTKVVDSTKRLVNYSNAGYYQVLSAEVGGKHGFSISGLIFDEIHVQPNRKLYDVLTKGTSDARANPLHFIITTAGTDRTSIAYELHQKALDILEGRRIDPTFYPVVYSLGDDEDWEDEKNWYKVNPSLGYTVDIERLRDAFREAKQNPADEMTFRWLRLNQWVRSTVRWMPMDKWDACGKYEVDIRRLEGRRCYGGLDLSSSTDITAFVLVFPPEDEDEPFWILPFFWIPEDNIQLRVRRDHVPYDVWEMSGQFETTEGNVIHYGYIEKFIEHLGERFNIQEIAFDRWGAVQMVQDLEGMGFTVIPFGQGFKDMSPPTKELMKLVLEGKIAHGNNPVLRWMIENAVVRTDPAGNIKLDKQRSTEKIDGAVAMVMGLDRAIRQQNEQTGSIYDERGLFFI